MKPFILHLAAFFSSLGGFGLFLLGILDSSFLFIPLGIDLLMVALTARRHEHILYYAAMCAAGSVVGCFTTVWISRKGGEAGLEHRISKRRLAYVQRRVERHGGIALAVASMAPPGFPFTIFLIVAGALKYPLGKLLGIVALFRFLRFLIEGWLAIWFGRQILRWADLPEVQYAVVALVVISIAGSVWSLWTWFRNSRRGAVKSA